MVDGAAATREEGASEPWARVNSRCEDPPPPHTHPRLALVPRHRPWSLVRVAGCQVGFGYGCSDRVRQVRGPHRSDPASFPLLQARVVRTVHSLPRGHGLDGADARPNGKGRRGRIRNPDARGDFAPDRGAHYLRAGRRGRVACAGPNPPLPACHGGPNPQRCDL